MIKRLFQPDLYLQKVTDLTAPLLKSAGVSGICLDVDCTITDYRGDNVPPDVAMWIAELKRNGVKICLVSNGAKPRIRRIAEVLGVPHVAWALKPLPIGCLRGVQRLGINKSEVAMVGDQIFADVWAGKVAGLRTVLVVPRGAERESALTRWKRPFERWVLRRLDLLPTISQRDDGKYNSH